MAGDISSAEMRQIARYLRGAPELTVHQAMRELQAAESSAEPMFDQASRQARSGRSLEQDDARRVSSPPQAGQPHTVTIERLYRVLDHLQRLQHAEISRGEMAQAAAILRQVESEVASLLEAFESP